MGERHGVFVIENCDTTTLGENHTGIARRYLEKPPLSLMQEAGALLDAEGIAEVITDSDFLFCRDTVHKLLEVNELYGFVPRASSLS